MPTTMWHADELLGAKFSEKVKKFIFQQLLSSASPEELASISEEEMNQQFEQAFGKMKFRIVPIGKTYFSGVNANHDKGNPGMYFILQLACILIIIVASINFLNFTLAESPARFKNVNTRRLPTISDRWGRITEWHFATSFATTLVNICMLLYPFPFSIA